MCVLTRIAIQCSHVDRPLLNVSMRRLETKLHDAHKSSICLQYKSGTHRNTFGTGNSTYKLANKPTVVCFVLSMLRNRSGFHSSASGPQISGKLRVQPNIRVECLHSITKNNNTYAYRLYAPMRMSIGVPFLTGMDEICSPDRVVTGKANGITSSRPAVLRSIQTMGCSLIDSYVEC